MISLFAALFTAATRLLPSESNSIDLKLPKLNT